MKLFIGLLLIAAGIILGLYVGIWLMFIGGIVQIIDAAKNNWEAIGIGVGILRIMFAGFVGWLAGFIFIVPGMMLVEDK